MNQSTTNRERSRLKRRTLVCGAALTIVAVAIPAVGAAQAAPSYGTIRVLSYNVNGLFPLAAAGNPGSRAETIGWLANKYDVVLLQEDFEYHADISAQMLGKSAVRGNGVGTDPRRVIPKALLAPFALVIPHFWPPYGSGLSVFARADLAIPGDVDRVPYGICNAWLTGTGDCWASKGFVRVGIRTFNGAEVDVYDTHLEASPLPESVAMRRKQLTLLAEAIEARGNTRAVIVGGDFNLGYNRPGDRDVLTEFRNRLDLRDTGAGPELPFWRERDHLLYRDGTGTTLAVLAAGEAQEFVNWYRALSDHPALYARFRVDPAEGAGTQ